MPAADDMRPPNDVRRHVSLGTVALIKQGNHPVKVDRIAGPAFALVRCEIPLASSDDLLLVLFDDLLYGLVIGVALRAKPTKKAPLNREHLDVMDPVAVPRPRRRTGRKCEVLVPWNIWGDVGAEGNRKVAPSPPVLQPNDQQTGTASLLHELAVDGGAPFQKVLRDRGL